MVLMTELEADVIEEAIEYVHQRRNGLYRDEPRYFQTLARAVDALEREHDWNWKRPDNEQVGKQQVPHEYGPTMVGHGNAQCKWCKGTDLENQVISPNHCTARALQDPKYQRK